MYPRPEAVALSHWLYIPHFLYLPLGILGAVRWSCWLVHRIPAAFYRPMVTGHREAMTVVTPVYEEDPVLFRRALESWLVNDVSEVICVVDVTDERCTAIAREYGSVYPVRVLVTDVPGKRPALALGWREARTPLVALVDSDTLWAPDVFDRVCEPFVDPRIGGVGTRQSALDPEGVFENAADMYLDYRYFDELASQSLVGKAVSCLSGRTAVYRREVLAEIEEDFLNETFLGVPCVSGDDKRLTMLTLRSGRLTFMQRNARVWSTFPGTFKKFGRQRLRWARNTWRSDLRSLGQGWVFRHPMLAFMMVDKMVSGFTLLLSFSLLITGVISRHWLFSLAVFSWWIVSRSAKLLPHLRRRPEELSLVPAFIAITVFMALIKVAALLTIRRQHWLTRNVGVQEGVVMRAQA